MNNDQKRVLNYYRSLESKLGYKFITGEIKHFGYYPESKTNISEQEAQRLMSDLVAKNLNLKRNQSVLDAGCGYGLVACHLAQNYGAKVIGIDLNAHEIAMAKVKAKKLALEDKARFVVADYTQTSFPDNTFDAIFTLETLSHSPNLAKTLKEFLRVLRTKGKVAFFEYTLAPKTAFNSQELEILNFGIKGTAALGLEEFRHDQFPDYLRSMGLRNIKEQDITKNALPSLQRLRKIAIIPYVFIKLFSLQKHFVNTTIAVEWYKLIKKDLIRYCIFTAEK